MLLDELYNSIEKGYFFQVIATFAKWFQMTDNTSTKMNFYAAFRRDICSKLFLKTLLTLSAMLRGWVAQPRLARILQATESSGICSSFSTAAISKGVCGKLNWMKNESEIHIPEKQNYSRLEDNLKPTTAIRKLTYLNKENSKKLYVLKLGFIYK